MSHNSIDANDVNTLAKKLIEHFKDEETVRLYIYGFLKLYSMIYGEEVWENLSILFGKKMHFDDLPSEKKQVLDKYASELFLLLKEIERIVRLNISEKEKSEMAINMLYTQFTSTEDIQKAGEIFDLFINLCQAYIQGLLTYHRYFSQTRIKEYKSNIESIVEAFYNESKRDLLRYYLSHLFQSSDGVSLLQSTFSRLSGYYEFLDKTFEHITEKDVEKFIQIYLELSGQFEKFSRFLIGLLNLLEGKWTLQDVERREELLKRTSLGRIINRLEKARSAFSKLMSPFNKTIRNSIAHKTYKLHPINERIVFSDRKKRCSYAYGEFINEVRELSAAILAFWSIQGINELHYLRFLRGHFATK